MQEGEQGWKSLINFVKGLSATKEPASHIQSNRGARNQRSSNANPCSDGRAIPEPEPAHITPCAAQLRPRTQAPFRTFSNTREGLVSQNVCRFSPAQCALLRPAVPAFPLQHSFYASGLSTHQPCLHRSTFAIHLFKRIYRPLFWYSKQCTV